MAGIKSKGGKKNRKFGRGKRAPSNANQKLRTEKNKRIRIERAAEALKHPKKLKVARGSKRRWRRGNLKKLVVATV